MVKQEVKINWREFCETKNEKKRSNEQVMGVLSEANLSSEDNTLNKAFIVYHYYTELEF